MSQQDNAPLAADIVAVKIERKRLNPETGELEDIEPIVIDIASWDTCNAAE